MVKLLSPEEKAAVLQELRVKLNKPGGLNGYEALSLVSAALMKGVPQGLNLDFFEEVLDYKGGRSRRTKRRRTRRSKH